MSTSAAFKRTREQESSIEDSSQSTSFSPTTTKALRLTRPGPAPLFCSLPPTCNPPHNQPIALANVSELEAHYAKFHAHVCEEKGCGAVFPNARLLELHQTECHDPIALLRKERGEKIFACHLDSCTRKFVDPKKRRLHLIQAHGYPKEYFFAVTNKGIGGLLKRWGEGASMIRGAWQARESQDSDKKEDTGSDEDGEDSIDEDMLSTGTVKVTSADTEFGLGKTMMESRVSFNAQPTSAVVPSQATTTPSDGALGDLASSMSSLSLIPRNIRFGRGGKGVRGTHETRASNTKARRAHNSGAAAQNEREVLQDTENAERNDVSINIDGALEALKSEAPSNVPARIITHAHAGNTGITRSPAPGRRSRGGRGRGRGSNRGQTRG